MGLAPVLAAVQAASSSGAILKLGAVAGAPLMPSLNGWLLGYPVVYLVDEGNVDAAALCLSHTPLLLLRALVDAPGVRPISPSSACLCSDMCTWSMASGGHMLENGVFACRPRFIAAPSGISTRDAEGSCRLEPPQTLRQWCIKHTTLQTSVAANARDAEQ